MRKRILSLFLACSLFTGIVLAEPRISGDLTIPRDRMGELILDGVAPGEAALLWDVSDEDAVDIREIGGRVLWTGKPGTYSVKLRIIRVVDGKPKVDTVRTRITVGDGKPGPNPNPGPGPNPGPTPPPTPPDPTPPNPVVEGPFFIVLIEETAEATVARARWFFDKALVERIRAKKHVWRTVDKDAVNERGETPKDLVPWVERARKRGLPTLGIADKKGNLVHWDKTPESPEALLKLLDKLGG